jgi:hypothetical protein
MKHSIQKHKWKTLYNSSTFSSLLITTKWRQPLNKSINRLIIIIIIIIGSFPNLLVTIKWKTTIEKIHEKTVL